MKSNRVIVIINFMMFFYRNAMHSFDDFVRMVVTEICRAVKRGEDVTDIVAKREPELEQFCETRKSYILEKEMEVLETVVHCMMCVPV